MVKRKFLTTIAVTILSIVCYSQSFSLSDTSLVFKDTLGKVLTRDQVKEYFKAPFSVRTEMKDGKKTLTIIPVSDVQRDSQLAHFDAFRRTLIGKPIGSFDLTDINGQKWNSSALKEKAIVINFWFTTCKPCIQEIPHLNELVKENATKNVVFIAPAPDGEEAVKKFLVKHPFDYNVTPAATDLISRLNVESFPTHLIIDKEGIIREVFIGYADNIKEKLQAEIDKYSK